MFTWPPPYTLHKNARSRRVRLKMCVHKGLQLVVPRTFRLSDVALTLQQHRPWIEKHWLRIQQQRALSPRIGHDMCLDFHALDEQWRLHYQPSSNARLSYEVDTINRCLMLRGATHDAVLLTKALQCWIRDHAQEPLLTRLATLSQQTGLGYARGSVRHARSRWGSCSSQKHIMLNAQLIFLSPAVVDYVMLHELCHTVHMNHSACFWALLESLSPACHELRRQLRHAPQGIFSYS